MSCQKCVALKSAIDLNKKVILDYRKSIKAPYDLKQDHLLPEQQQRRLKAYEERFDESREALAFHLQTEHP